jgi:hypothetical protein
VDDDFEVTPAVREYLRRFEASLRASEADLPAALAARQEALEHLLEQSPCRT